MLLLESKCILDAFRTINIIKVIHNSYVQALCLEQDDRGLDGGEIEGRFSFSWYQGHCDMFPSKTSMFWVKQERNAAAAVVA